MSNRPTFITRRSGERGVALILTLAILAMVTLLVIAFVTSMRVENAASKNYNGVIQARELVKGTVDQAVAQIRAATPQRSATSYYVTGPGVIYTSSAGGSAPVYLFPGGASVVPGDPINTTNLNGGSWITGGTDSGGEFPPNNPNSQINVGWVYVAQNPATLPGPNNPIIGRYTYWVDDEASKINVNTAGAPPYTFTDPQGLGVGSTSNAVDLSVLPDGLGALAPSIQSGNAAYPRVTYPYVTTEQIKSANVAITNLFDDSCFEVTAYSSDANYPLYADDLDVYDRPRLSLNPATLGIAANFATAASELSANMVNVFGGNPTAFASKYGGANGVNQIIANIIGYQIDPTKTPPPDDGSAIPTPPAYVGLARTPYINEILITYAISPSGTPGTYNVQRTIQVELYCMYGAYSPGTEQVILNNLPTAGGLFSAGPFAVTPAGAGPYFVGSYADPTPVQITTAVTIPPQTALTGPTQITYSRQYAGVYHRLHYAQMDLPTVILTPSVSGTVNFYQDAEANDPAVGPWATSTTVGTIGLQNNAYSQTADPTLGAKAIPSKAVMRTAPMLSIGELGYIHTPNAWQYLTLQPNTSGQIPDWAMLDLFTVGTGTGRMNINSLINPGLSEPTAQRLAPLTALLNSLSGTITPGTLAGIIYADAAASRFTGTDSYGMKQSSGAGIFDSIGELCELSSLIPPAAVLQADKEATIRRIANLITVRSNTFTIWALAQSIKQPPSNPNPGTFNPLYDVITGDVKAQAVVERYEKPPGVVGTTPEFRTRYFRYLYN